MSVFAVLLLAAAPQAAECGDASSTAAIVTCLDTAYHKADDALNALWPRVLAQARKADRAMGAPGAHAAKSLLAAQRLWIGFRDAECSAEASAAQGGTLENVIFSQCMLRMTRERIQALENINHGF